MMDGDRDETRSDWSGSDGRRPPIMGKRQSLRDYAADCRNWFLTLEVDKSKAGPLVLTRGLSRVPRIQDLGKRIPSEELTKHDGLEKLFTFVSAQLGITDVPSKVQRFASLISQRRSVEPVDEWVEKFERAFREIVADGLVTFTEAHAALILLISLQLTPQQMSNLCTVVTIDQNLKYATLVEGLRRVVIPNCMSRQVSHTACVAGCGPPSDQWVGPDTASEWCDWEHDWAGEPEPWADAAPHSSHIAVDVCRVCGKRGHWGNECWSREHGRTGGLKGGESRGKSGTYAQAGGAKGAKGGKKGARKGGKAASHWVGESGEVWIRTSRGHDETLASGQAAAPVDLCGGSGAETAATGDEHVTMAVFEPPGPRQTDGDSADSFEHAFMARVEDSDSGRVCADGSWAFPAPGAQEAAGNQESADGRWDIPAPGTQDVMPAEESASGSVRQAEVTRLSGAGRALAVGLRLAGGDVAKDAAHELELLTNARPELRDEAYCSRRMRAVEESATSYFDKGPVAGAAARAAASELAVLQRAQDLRWQVDAGRRQSAAMKGLLAATTRGCPDRPTVIRRHKSQQQIRDESAGVKARDARRRERDRKKARERRADEIREKRATQDKGQDAESLAAADRAWDRYQAGEEPEEEALPSIPQRSYRKQSKGDTASQNMRRRAARRAKARRQSVRSAEQALRVSLRSENDADSTGLAIVDTGATRGLVGLSTYRRYKEYVARAEPAREFREFESTTKFRVANGQMSPALFEASIPLPLQATDGQVFPARSTWCVVQEEGDAAVPFLLSRPQMSNLNMNVDLGSSCVTARIGGAMRPLCVRERGGHLAIPMFPILRHATPCTSPAPATVAIDASDNARASSRARRKAKGGASCVAFSTLPDPAEAPEPLATRPTPVDGVYVVDYPACFTVGDPDLDFANVTREQVNKIHRQMWHADAPTLIKWVLPAVPPDAPTQARVRKMIAAAVAGCHSCGKHAKVHPRPRHGGLLARAPNEIVAMDMFDLQPADNLATYKCLHLMDVATKFSRVYVVTAKQGRSVVHALVDWSAMFSRAPAATFSDQGPEFVNSVVTDWCQARGVRQLYSPPYTPASNGLIERHNGIFKTLFYRLFEASRAEFARGALRVGDIVTEACAAKNAAVKKCGFSAHYLVFGYAPQLQANLGGTFAEEQGAVHEYVRVRDELRSRAQRLVLELKTQDGLRAILTRRLNGTLGYLAPQTLVEMHPREDPKGVFTGRKWVGPCSVLCQEGRMVWLRFPDGTARLVHRHRIRPIQDDSRIVQELTDRAAARMEWPQEAHLKDVNMPGQHPAVLDGARAEGADGVRNGSAGAAGGPVRCANSGGPADAPLGEGGHDTDAGRLQHDDPPLPDTVRPAVAAGPCLEGSAAGPRQGVQLSTGQAEKRCREGDAVTQRYAERREKRRREAAALADWLEDSDVEEGRWDIPAPGFVDECLAAPAVDGCRDGPAFDDAKEAEWQQWVRNDVFEWVPDEGQSRQRSRWVLTERVLPGPSASDTPDGAVGAAPPRLKRKARLCAQGTASQDPQAAELFAESPTASKLAVNIALATAAKANWDVWGFDVSSAFLQGDALGCGDPDPSALRTFGVAERQLYLRAPPEYHREGYLLRLKKVVYGYADAPRRWFVAADAELRRLGFQPTRVDPAAYSLSLEGAVCAILCLHVDDGLVACNAAGWAVAKKFTDRFKVGKLACNDLVFLGLAIRKNECGAIVVSQRKYIHDMQPALVCNGRASKKEDRLSPAETTELRRTLGALQWVASQTRPDLAGDVSMLQRRVQSPRVADLLAAQKLVRRLKASDDLELRFEPTGAGSRPTLLTFTDAALQNVLDNSSPPVKVGSQGGHLVMEVETSRGELLRAPRFNVVAWRSRKIQRVCRSSFAAECLEACSAADTAFVARCLWSELTGVMPMCYLVTDSLNLRDHIRCIANNTTEKRLKVDLFALKEVFQREELNGLLWIDGTENPADSLTKNSPILGRILRSCRLDLSTLV